MAGNLWKASSEHGGNLAVLQYVIHAAYHNHLYTARRGTLAVIHVTILFAPNLPPPFGGSR